MDKMAPIFRYAPVQVRPQPGAPRACSHCCRSSRARRPSRLPPLSGLMRWLPQQLRLCCYPPLRRPLFNQLPPNKRLPLRSSRLAQPSTLPPRWTGSVLDFVWATPEGRPTGWRLSKRRLTGKCAKSPKSASRERESRRARYSARGRSTPELGMVGETPVEVDAALLHWLDAWGVVDVIGRGVSAQSWADVQNGKARRHPKLRDICTAFKCYTCIYKVNILWLPFPLLSALLSADNVISRHSKKFCGRLSAPVTWRGGRS